MKLFGWRKYKNPPWATGHFYLGPRSHKVNTWETWTTEGHPARWLEEAGERLVLTAGVWELTEGPGCLHRALLTAWLGGEGSSLSSRHSPGSQKANADSNIWASKVIWSVWPTPLGSHLPKIKVPLLLIPTHADSTLFRNTDGKMPVLSGILDSVN